METIQHSHNAPICSVCPVGGWCQTEPATARRHPLRPNAALWRRHLLHPPQCHPPVQNGLGSVQPGVAHPPEAVPLGRGGGRGQGRKDQGPVHHIMSSPRSPGHQSHLLRPLTNGRGSRRSGQNGRAGFPEACHATQRAATCAAAARKIRPHCLRSSVFREQSFPSILSSVLVHTRANASTGSGWASVRLPAQWQPGHRLPQMTSSLFFSFCGGWSFISPDRLWLTFHSVKTKQNKKEYLDSA